MLCMAENHISLGQCHERELQATYIAAYPRLLSAMLPPYALDATSASVSTITEVLKERVERQKKAIHHTNLKKRPEGSIETATVSQMQHKGAHLSSV